MARFGSQYRIARSSGECAETGRPIEPGAPCIAALCEDDEAAFQRFDYSIEAWEAGARPEGMYSFWRTRMPERGEKKKVFVDDQVLLDIFERLAEDGREVRQAFRYVLALILIRKRLMRYAGRKTEAGDDGAEHDIWLLRPKGSDPDVPPLEVLNPGLSDGDILELSEQLADVLQGDF